MPPRQRCWCEELCPYIGRLVRISPHGHGNAAVFVDRLAENFGMAVQPAYPRSVGRIEAKFNHFPAGGKPRLDRCSERVEPLPRRCGS